ncbi:hypothetical protein DLAC_04090 [Tieghemostelium lacteum]|uniref:separase n=1 Tax=Tieghemostelium lacteum TaxID=361077 RepID=A0A151ZRY9_TIELA|nr:hypothetical protein DLAC_04090 [Tieghemostelium lacteum]|eukprot:KYQ96791.1 hypothetical protein DLAC_04090 [Tieghemostelium lacteum]
MESIDTITNIFDDKNEYKNLITKKKGDSYTQFEKLIIEKYQNAINEYIKKNDGKGLVALSEKLVKILNEYFTTKFIGYQEGLSVLVECNILILKSLDQWSLTKQSSVTHKKWLLIGGVLLEHRICRRAIDLMNDLLGIISDFRSTATSNHDYFDRLIIHATFIKLQCFEDTRILMGSTSSIMLLDMESTYRNWFQNLKFELTEKPTYYHEALFIKFYNRCAQLMAVSEQECPNRDEILYHYNFMTWTSIGQIKASTGKFFEKLSGYLLALQKKGYFQKSLKMLGNTIEIVKFTMVPIINAESYTRLEPYLVVTFSTLSLWFMEINQPKNSLELLSECTKHIDKIQKLPIGSKYFQMDIRVLELYLQLNRCHLLVHLYQRDRSDMECERELISQCTTITSLVATQLTQNQFIIDQQQEPIKLETKLIYLKILGMSMGTLDRIMAIYYREKSGSRWKQEITESLNSLLQLFVVIPAVVIKILKQMEGHDQQKQFYKNPMVDDFIQSYSSHMNSLWKCIIQSGNTQVLVSGDFPVRFHENNNKLITIHNEFGNPLEEFLNYLYNISIHYQSNIRPSDYEKSLFYIENAIKIHHGLIQRNLVKVIPMERLSQGYWSATQSNIKLHRQQKAHQYAVELVKLSLHGSKSITDILHQQHQSTVNTSSSSQKRPFQEILRLYIKTQLKLFQFQKQQLNNGTIQFINDIIKFNDTAYTVDFKIQLYDLTLLALQNSSSKESNIKQHFHLLQIERILQDIANDHPLLRGRYLMEKAKLLRFSNPQNESIDQILHDSIDLIKSQDLLQDQSLSNAVFNELAKVHYWRAITFLEIHQFECKDILTFLNSQDGKANNRCDESEANLFKYASSSSTQSISNFIKQSNVNRFRSPVFSSDSIISKELKLCLNLWCKLLDLLQKPKIEDDQSSIKQLTISNSKYFISPHTTISLLYSISDIYSFEGDFINAIFVLKVIICFIKCLFEPQSQCYQNEVSKCYLLISSHYIELENYPESYSYLTLNGKLIPPTTDGATLKFPSAQIQHRIHLLEYYYHSNQQNLHRISKEVLEIYEQCLKVKESNKESFDISLFVKISRLASNIYLSQSNSAQSFKISDKLNECILTTIPSESIDLIKSPGHSKEDGFNTLFQFPTTSKWSSLKLCLESILHISSVYELRGRPLEAQYYYERALLIGIMYGSVKVTCDFLVEIAELFYHKHNYTDSKINLELVQFLASRLSNNEVSLKNPQMISSMLLGDIYRKQNLIQNSKLHYNKCLEILESLRCTDQQQKDHSNIEYLLTNNLFNINNNSTPKESRILKLLTSTASSSTTSSNISKMSRSTRVSNNNQLEDIINSLVDMSIDKSNSICDNVNDNLKSFQTRIRGKLSRLLMIQGLYEEAIESLESLLNDTEGTENEITKSILEFHLGRAYLKSCPEQHINELWTLLPTTTSTVKLHPMIQSARDLFLRSYKRIGKFNIIKLNSSICKYLCLTTGQILPYVTSHFLNLSIGIKCRHDMQSIVQYQKSLSDSENSVNKNTILKNKEMLFSWDGGVEIPNNLSDPTFISKLKSIYSTQLPDWLTCNIAIEEDSLIIGKYFQNRIPLFTKIQIPLFDITSLRGTIKNKAISQSFENIGNGGDPDNEDEDVEMEMEIEEDDDDDENDENQQNNFYSNYQSTMVKESDESLRPSLTLIDKLKGDLKTIQIENLFNDRENAHNRTKKGHTAWTFKRKALEIEIKRLLEVLDHTLGYRKSMLFSPLADKQEREILDHTKQRLLEKLNKDYEIHKVTKQINSVIFEHLFYAIGFLGENALVKGIIEMMGYQPLEIGVVCDQHPHWMSIKKIYETMLKDYLAIIGKSKNGPPQVPSSNTIGNLDENQELFIQLRRLPLVLIIDKDLESLPFESLDPFYYSSVYRLPSFAFQRLHCGYNQIRPQSAYYMLNPSANLKQTEEQFYPIFKDKFPLWKGIVGQTLVSQEYSEMLQSYDTFLYMGHGSGEQYLRGDKIQKLQQCAVSILMGCKSGQLEEQGEFESTGVVLDFLLAGSKSIVGNIYDIPTTDCDRLTLSLLNQWFSDAYKTNGKNIDYQYFDLALAVANARKSCEWKYLVGASCICYGIPTFLTTSNKDK